MVLILLMILIAAVLGFSYFAYRIAFFAPEKGREAIPATSGAHYDPYREVMKLIYTQLAEREYEDVYVTSHDGLRLHGRYYHVRDGAPLDICLHGYRSSPMTDFSGGAELSLELGHNLLLVDQRGHGKSQGKTITFGILERHDCLTWINWALEQLGRDTQILLYGISMGASTVLMASGLELPHQVKGIVADCPYNAPMAIICNVSDGMRIPSKLVKPFLILGARLYGGFRLRETNAAQAVANSKVPILIIHGEADTFVPCSMSEEIFAASVGNVRRCTFPGAEHGISYLVDKQRYSQIVSDFINQVTNSAD